jgi:hypothetical protein
VVINADELAAFGREFHPASALHLEMMRLSGLRWVVKRDGWVSPNRESLEAIGLVDKRARHRAVKRLVACRFLEVRSTGTGGRKLEYRLRPDWARPSAEVIDLKTVKPLGRGKRSVFAV